MPTFTTPDPIDLAVDLPVGDSRSSRATAPTPSSPCRPPTGVGRRPPRRRGDRSSSTAAGDRRRLRARGSASSARANRSTCGSSCPTGSRLTADVGGASAPPAGSVRPASRARSGGVDIDATGDLWVRAGHGNARRSAPPTAASSSSPTTARSASARSAGTRSSSRRTARSTIGEAGGDLDAKLSYGELEIERARSASSPPRPRTARSASARCSSGSVAGRERLRPDRHRRAGRRRRLARRRLARRPRAQRARGRSRHPAGSDDTVAVRARTSTATSPSTAPRKERSK